MAKRTKYRYDPASGMQRYESIDNIIYHLVYLLVLRLDTVELLDDVSSASETMAGRLLFAASSALEAFLRDDHGKKSDSLLLRLLVLGEDPYKTMFAETELGRSLCL